MKVHELMSTDVQTVDADQPAKAAAAIMKEANVGSVPVTKEDRKLVGIITDRDLALRILAECRDPQNTNIGEVMSPDPVTCGQNDALEAALETMQANQIRRLPVIDDTGRLVGILAQADIAKKADEWQTGELVEAISR